MKTSNFFTASVLSSFIFDIQLRFILQYTLPTDTVEAAFTTHGAYNSSSAVSRVTDSCDHIVHILPRGYSLLRDIPQSDFAVYRAGNEEFIVGRVEINGCDEISVPAKI